MTLYVDRNEPLEFKCKSRLPITLSTTWEYDKKLISSSLQKSYWKYQEVLVIKVPKSNESQWESELKWRYIEVWVKCALQDENLTESVVWNYRLHTIRKIFPLF